MDPQVIRKSERAADRGLAEKLLTDAEAIYLSGDAEVEAWVREVAQACMDPDLAERARDGGDVLIPVPRSVRGVLLGERTSGYGAVGVAIDLRLTPEVRLAITPTLLGHGDAARLAVEREVHRQLARLRPDG